MYALFHNGRQVGHESDDKLFIIHQALKFGAIYNVWKSQGECLYQTREGYTIEEVKE